MIKILVKSSEESREVEFNGEPITIGRSSENVLKLADKKASRHHAKIEKVDGEYRVFDLGSGNGTKLNGSDIPGSAGLNKGDEIVVGLSTLYVLNLDAPAKAAPVVSAPPLPVATLAPPPAPVAAAPASSPKPAEEPRKSPITRRAHYARSSSSGGLVAVVAVLIIGGAIFFAASRMGSSAPASVGKPKPTAKKAGPTINEANEAYTSFKAKAGSGASEELLAEADRLSDRYGEIFPDFHKLAAEIRTRRNESLSSKGLETVRPIVDKAVAEQRFGDAIDALKALRGGKDAEEAGKLLASIESKVDDEYKTLNETGGKLVADHKYEPAAELYREAAPKFRNTRHYRTVQNKPENLMQMAQAEIDAQKMKEARAKAEADAALAKAETPKPAPVPEMKPEMPKPAPAMKPEMKPEMPKPAPAMKPEMPKPPPPPPPPPPPMPKEEPKKEEPKKDGPKLSIKKPEVLCDVKKTAKGNYCVGCDRMLLPDDVRGGNCKKCDEKPKKIDVCVKRYFQSECEHKKIDDKPVFCCGKVHDFPHEDRAAVAYLCESCGQSGWVRDEIKHAEECKNRLSATKICQKSGTAPHAPDKK